MKNARVDLLVGLETTNPEEAERFARELMRELRNVDGIASIKPLSVHELPKGAKAAGGWDFGAIMVALLEAGGITALVTALGHWLNRNKNRSIKLQLGEQSLEVTNLTQKEQQELIQWFQTQTSMRLTP